MRRVMGTVGAVAGVVATAVLMGGASGSAGSGEAVWVIRDLGTLGGKVSTASGINERGQIIGSSRRRGCDHAFLWENGKMRDLGAPEGSSFAGAINERGDVIGQDGGCDPGSNGYASFVWRARKRVTLGPYVDLRAVNDRGHAVGIDKGSREASQAFLWQGGKMTSLDNSPRASGAEDISEGGQIVGVSGRDAVLWEGGKMQNLGFLPGKKRSAAVAINEHGQVIGSSFTRQEPDEARTVLDGQAAYGERAFLWQDGEMRDLGTLPGTAFSSPGALNDRGEVIGISYRRMNEYGIPLDPRAFVWESGAMTELPLLPGGKFSSAAAINDGGEVIGTSYRRLNEYDSPLDPRAFVWESGAMTELPLLPGGKFSSAAAINNSGQIVGWATTKTGREHAVLWTLRSG